MQFDPTLIIFYVDSLEKSLVFYAELLGAKPIHAELDYAMFLLKPELRLGLWAKKTVQPTPTNNPGAAELVFQVNDAKEIDQLYENAHRKHFSILQSPTQMDFGYTFVIADINGHRIRFYFRQLA